MKVLLISANSLTTPYPVYPLGIDYVADAISSDHDVRIVDVNSCGGHNTLGGPIRDYGPDIVGMSLRNIDNVDKLDKKGFIGEYRGYVKAVRRHSNAPIVLGGSGFTLFPSEIMEALGAEYGVVGEGERLGLFLRAIEREEDLSGIPGIITLGKEIMTPLPLDKPFAERHLPDSPHIQYYLDNGGMLNLQTKRGCVFKCIYCTYPRIEGNSFRFIPPGKVARTALRLQESGARYFFVTDSVLNGDYSHSLQVARAFMDVGISIPWGGFFAPTNPPEGYFRVMADAGLSHVEFGTESLCGPMLQGYRKPFRIDHVFNAHEAAREAGLHVAHYFLLGGPGESEDSVDETLTNIDKLKRSVFFFFALFVFIRIRPFMILHCGRARFQEPRAC